MEKPNKTSVGMPAVAGSNLTGFTGKGERSKNSMRRAWSRVVWLGLGIIGANVAPLGIQPVQASTSLYDVQFSNSGIHQAGAAVIGSAGDVWNLMSTATGSSNLLNSSGTSGTVSATWSAEGIYNFASTFGGGNAPLMGGYLYAHSAQGISFAGLPAGQPYTLYVYSQSDVSGRRLSVTVDSTTYTTTASAFPTTFIAGQNYLTITGITDGSGNLAFTYNAAVGEADLNGIQLSVANAAPSITSQSASQTIGTGATAVLSVTATSTGPLHYQWVKDGRIISGATNSVLSLSNAGVTNSGVYYVAITNAYGLGLSRPATVMVGNPQLLAWGNNGNGQLGDGTLSEKHFPESVASNVVAAAVGGNHSLYLKSAGTLWAMGYNGNGQLGDGTHLNRSNAVSVASNVVAVAAGQSHSLYLKSDGTLWAMGYNGNGQFGDGTTTSRSNAVSVASNVTAMAAGANFSLFLKSDGTLWAMGYNLDGELGDGSTTDRHSPVAVQGGTNVVTVAAGAGVSLFVKSDGTLWALGYNQDGELGDGTYTNRSTPVAVLNGSNVVAAAAGANHSLFLKRDGTLWAMGDGQFGELGDGTMTVKQTPPESVASNTMAVAAGADHSLYLKNDGTLWVMGRNYNGELGDGTTLNRSNAVPIGGVALATVVSGCKAYHTLAIGQIFAPVITSQPTSQAVLADTNVTFTVTASGFNPLAYQWYFNGNAISGATATNYDLAGVTMNDAGSYTVVVSNSIGSVTSSVAALMVFERPSIATQPSNQVADVGGTVNLGVSTVGSAPLSFQWFKNGGMILGATNSALILPNAGVTNSGVYYVVATYPYGLNISVPATVTVGTPQLLVWGDNQFGQLGDGTTIHRSLPESVASNVVTAAAGYSHSLFLKGDGTLWAAGRNMSGELGDGTYAEKHWPESVASNVVAVAAGSGHSLFLKSNGTLWGMGYNEYGQLGDGTTTNRSLPESVASNVVAVAAGAYHSLFLKSDGTMWTMGYNYDGELGDGTTTDRSSPVAVLGGSNVVAVAAGAGVSFFLKSDGTLWAIGYNRHGELGDGTGINQSTPVAVLGGSNVVMATGGSDHSLFLKSDGSLWAMGFNSNGQLGDGTTTGQIYPKSITNNVVAVAAGWFNSLFLKNDSTLWAMGNNEYGQLGDGTTTQRNSPVPVPGLSLATVVSGCSAYHTLAVGLVLPPVITTQPTDQTVVIGSNVTFTVVASGFGQLTYQWQFNGTNLMNATNTSYTLTSVALNNAGSYTVVVTNTQGSTASTPAILTVNLPSVVVTGAANPTDAGSVAGGGAYIIGSNAVLTATASNDWQFVCWNDGATNNPYTVTVPETNITYTANFAATATIMVEASPIEGGSVTGGGTYLVGNTNFISATASNGWIFVEWSDGSTINPYGILTETNTTITATFAPTATIIVNADPLEGGSVTGGGTFLVGSTNSISATASNGWAFVTWSDGSTLNSYAIVLETNLTLTATFAPAVTVTVTADPTNAGSVMGGGVYVIGSNTVLTATASNDWQFVYWNDGATNNPYPITVPETNITYTATFAPTATITVEASPVEGGSVAGSGTYLVGSTNFISATASNGWAFAAWSDGSTLNPYAIVVETNLTLTAEFAPAVTVTVTADPTNAGYITGGGVLIIGSNAVLTATASNDWQFVCWNDGATNNPYTVTVPETNITYTATFATTATITVNASPVEGGSVTGGGTYLVGSTNLLTATANSGWLFTGWSDGATHSPYAIVATTNQTYTANFVPAATVTVIINPTNAVVEITGDGVHPVGSNAVLTATGLIPTSSSTNRWKFLNWNGTVTNYTKTGITNNPLTFTVTTNITRIANFAQVTSAGLVYTHIWVTPKSPVIIINSKIAARPLNEALNETLTEGIAIIGYAGVAHSLTIPANIDGLPVNQIASGALTGEKFSDVGIEIDDGITSYTVEGTSIDAEYLEFEGEMLALDELIAAGELAVAADAVVDCSEVEFAAGVTGAVIAFFAEIISDLSPVYVDASPSSGGYVTGGGLYIDGWTVELTANPNSGWRFKGWGDGGGGAGTTNRLRTVHAGAQTASYTANFTQQSKVTVVAAPEEGGLVYGGGTFDVGSEIIITATNNLYWKFMEWSDGSTNAMHTITVPENDITYTATFEELKLEVEAEAGPNIGGVAPGFTTGSGEYGLLEAVTITATPVIPKWKFNKWVLKVGGVPLDSHLFTNSSPVPSVLLFMVTPEMLGLKLTVDADFSTDVEVTTAANPPYAGSVEGEGSCEWPPVMDNLPLVTATPADGWAFTGWDSPYTTNYPGNPFCPILDMVTPVDFTVTANFTPTRLTTYASGNSLTLDWPTGLVLQSQTNTLDAVNWFDVPGLGTSNSVEIIMNPANSAVFYRLRQP